MTANRNITQYQILGNTQYSNTNISFSTLAVEQQEGYLTVTICAFIARLSKSDFA